MTMPQPPALEEGITTDLRDRLSYSAYLRLDLVLAAQQPRSGTDNHDELLFIVQHQVAELWLKLVLSGLLKTCEELRADRPDPALKMLARIKQALRQLVEQWSVLDTLTPSEYARIRPHLGPSSGFQSLQYRQIEFLLGNKNPALLAVFAHQPAEHAALHDLLAATTLYDEVLRHLARRGLPVPRAVLERDLAQPWQRQPELLPVLVAVYQQPQTHWAAYQLCEALVDLESGIQLWRFRHLMAVERILGHKQGTGGSSGVPFLRKALELRFFPELFDLRTELGA